MWKRRRKLYGRAVCCVQYQGKRHAMYFSAVITEVDEDEMYHVTFYKCNGKDFFLFDEEDTDLIGVECIKCVLEPPDVTQKKEEVYYTFDYSKYNIKLE